MNYSDSHLTSLFPRRHFDSSLIIICEKRGVPEKINLGGSAASRAVVVELQEEDILPASLTVRKGKYLNNVIEQDYRHAKQRVRSMLGFKRFAHAR